MIDFNKPDEEIVKTEGFDGSLSSISDNNILSNVWRLVTDGGRWFIWRYIFYGSFLMMFMAAGYFGIIKQDSPDIAADEMSTHVASDGYIEALKVFVKSTDNKNQLLNIHPFYDTDTAREIESNFKDEYGYKIKLKKLFKYYDYNGMDYLVMKKAAKGKDKNKLILELSTMTGTDAEDYCDIFGAVVWDNELRNVFKDKMSIRNESGELTQDNDDKASHFRCVIMPDEIQDAIDD